MTPIARVHLSSAGRASTIVGARFCASSILSLPLFEAVERLDRRRAVALGIVHPSCVSLSAVRMLGSSPRLLARRL